MLKIKDKTIHSGYKGFWAEEKYNYIDFEFNIIEDFDKYDIKYIIDNFLKDEGYVVDFENIGWFGNEQVIYWNFDDRYSIELYSIGENEFVLYFVLKEFDNFDDLYELIILHYYQKAIIKKIKADLIEKVN